MESQDMDTVSLWSPEYLIGQWRPEIGDPSFMGWFTVFSYFACALATFCASRAARDTERRAFLFWSAICLLMILLGINKQLDLQSLFTEVGRQIARYQGWMDNRRVVQFWFIILFAAAALTSFVAFAFFMRDLFRRFRLAFLGLFFLITFIVIRAAGFHHVDEILQSKLMNVKMNWLLELSGIYAIVAAALIDRRASASPARNRRRAR
jgi:hypothetical protein